MATTIVQGQSIDPQQLVANTNDADEAVPAAKIVNPEVLNEIGQQKVTVQLTYETGSLVTVNVPVTVEAPAKSLICPSYKPFMLRLVKQTNIQFTLGSYSLPLGLKQLFLPIISRRHNC